MPSSLSWVPFIVLIEIVESPHDHASVGE